MKKALRRYELASAVKRRRISQCYGQHRLVKIDKPWWDSGGFEWREWECANCHCRQRIRYGFRLAGRRVW